MVSLPALLVNAPIAVAWLCVSTNCCPSTTPAPEELPPSQEEVPDRIPESLEPTGFLASPSLFSDLATFDSGDLELAPRAAYVAYLGPTGTVLIAHPSQASGRILVAAASMAPWLPLDFYQLALDPRPSPRHTDPQSFLLRGSFAGRRPHVLVHDRNGLVAVPVARSTNPGLP